MVSPNDHSTCLVKRGAGTLTGIAAPRKHCNPLLLAELNLAVNAPGRPELHTAKCGNSECRHSRVAGMPMPRLRYYLLPAPPTVR